MTATTVTVPTLLLVLPLMAVVLVVWVWFWNRWVMPRFRARLDRFTHRSLVGAGYTPEKADQLIAQWKAEGWPDTLPEEPSRG